MLKTKLQIAVAVLVIAILCLLFYKPNNSQEVKHYYPNFTVNYKKKIGEKEWKHFNYAVSECRIVFKSDTFLQARAGFWEEHGIEPAVGYAAWLFQESRFDGFAVGDQGRAHGYGQIHPPALQEMNKIRKTRGDQRFSHEGIRGRSRERLRFFMRSLHDYTNLCFEKYGKKKSLRAKLNSWNGGCSGGSLQETKYSGGIKSIILQYYERKKAEEEQKRKAGTRACRLSSIEQQFLQNLFFRIL